MQFDVVELAKNLIAIESASQISNAEIAQYVAGILSAAGFEVEELAYLDEEDRRKVSLVAKKGVGNGGFGLFSHSDTVPADSAAWEPFVPVVRDGHLIGRGSCDMKGPLAATIVAGARFASQDLRKPLYLIITADEEIGYGGAKQVVADSRTLVESWPEHGVIAEPTRLRPVYAHKGGIRIQVTAYGVAAHTSTDRGVSANFLIAPFMAEMTKLVDIFRSDERFTNREFDPPTNGFNMVIDDGGCQANVTAAKTVCTVGLRSMPHDHRQEAVQMILDSASRYNLEADWYGFEPFYVAPDAPIVRAALDAVGATAPETVPFGTEAAIFKDHTELVILGPGDIKQAHTMGEWIDISQLQDAVHIYARMIEHFCI